MILESRYKRKDGIISPVEINTKTEVSLEKVIEELKSRCLN